MVSTVAIKLININLNLRNYQNWQALNVGLPVGPYNSIVNINGVLITNYSEKISRIIFMKFPGGVFMIFL